MRSRTILLAMSVLASLTWWGCATVPMATPQASAQMKRWQAPPDSAVVYVYRNETLAFGVHMDVSLDGIPYGQTVAKTYMVWEVPPGPHRLVSKAENDSDLTVNFLPGRRYFVWQEVKMGILFARSRLQQVSDAQGQSGVDECELVGMPLPRRRPPSNPAPASAGSPPSVAPSSETIRSPAPPTS